MIIVFYLGPDDFGHSNERVPQLTLEKAEDREDILRKLMVQLVPKCIRIKDNTELIENLIQAAYEISFCHDSYLRYFDALNVVYEKFCDRKDVIDHHLWTVFLYRYKIKLENIKDQLEQRCSEK